MHEKEKEKKVESPPDVREQGMIVLEDESTRAQELKESLERKLGIRTWIAHSTKELRELLKHVDPLVVSVDWRSGERDMGSTAINMSRKAKTSVAIVVYTQHGVEKEARGQKVEFFLMKQVGEETYVSSVDDAKDLTVMRTLRPLLIRLGVKDLPEPPGAEDADHESIDSFREQFVTELCRQHLRCTPAVERREIEDLTKNSRFLDHIDPGALVSKGYAGSIRFLVEQAGGDYEALLEHFLLKSGHKDYEELEQSSVYVLLGQVLTFVASVSGYSADFIRKIWCEPNMFSDDGEPPPWNDGGLYAYLIDRNTKGLEEASSWVSR